MSLLDLLHPHATHRSRQLRWLVPLGLVALGGVLATLAVQYVVGEQDVSQEFFRAHKTIAHTGQLLERGTLLAAALLAALVAAVGAWALRVTHRIVRPVHTLHQALDALVRGDLGVRVELHGADEFHEVGEALNRLVDEFGTTLARIHELADDVVALAETNAGPAPEAARAAQLHAIARELDDALEFFRLAPRRVIRAEPA